MWTKGDEIWLLGRSASTGLLRPPTILQGQNNGSQSVPGAAVQDAWLMGILNRHLAGENLVPSDAKVALISGMFVGGVRQGGQSSMILIDFWDGQSPQPAPNIWPGDQGMVYCAVSGPPGTQTRMPFGVLAVPIVSVNGNPVVWFRWTTTGDKANPAGYNLWLSGFIK